MSFYFATVSNDIAATVTTAIVVLGAFSIPIIKLLINHQQRMTELMRNGSVPQQMEDHIRDLRTEIGLLHDRLNQIALKLDGQPPVSVLDPAAEPESLRSSI